MVGQQPLTLAAGALDTFGKLYRASSFDSAIFISYTTVLTILSVYGLHRLWLVYTYLRWRRNLPGPAPAVVNWPSVTIQLPIYNERYVIERLLNAVAQLDYPRELLDIQILDDSTDDTQEVARACVKRHQARGLPIRYLRRGHRTGFKAGNLAEGLKSATGELIAHFDADFVPAADFLRRTVPYFSDPKIAVVQARWTYLNGNYSLLTEIETIMLDGHFVIEQGARSRSGAFFNFNGTAGVCRRTAIDDSGGWQHDTLTEDTDLSYRAQLRGWRFIYLPEIECLSELPIEMSAFKTQQTRWSKGLIQTAKKLLPQILSSDAPVRAKAEAFFHLTAGISAPLMVVFSILVLPASIVRVNGGWFLSLLVNLLGFLTSCAIAAFYIVSQRELHPRAWKRPILYLPLLIALGIGLSLCNAKAVLEALFGVKSDFVRTPKYNLDSGSPSWHDKTYSSPTGWMPWLEITFGLYYLFVFVYMLHIGNYKIAPFLLLFVLGFLCTGVMSVTQRWWDSLQPSQRRAPSSGLHSAALAPVFPPDQGEPDRPTLLDSAPAVEGGSETL
jgi:cellulose synthase/poly-beta-1,6-N-acetylglucosamine synthase-like glycosyltransferase